MGEAKKRGTFEERSKIAIDARMKLTRARAAALEERMANEPQEIKNRRINQQTMMTAVMGLASTSMRPQPSATEPPPNFLTDD